MKHIFFLRILLCLSILGLPTIGGLPCYAQRAERITNAQKRQLENFFNIFARTNLHAFKQGKLSNKALIGFGVMDNFFNNSKAIISGHSADRLPEKYVQASAYKYFGKKILHHEAPSPGLLYQKGYYLINFSGGEQWQFTQVDSFASLGHNEYGVALTLYTADPMWEGDVHSDPKTWRGMNGGDKPVYSGDMVARIKRVTENGRSRYILIEYMPQPVEN